MQQFQPKARTSYFSLKSHFRITTQKSIKVHFFLGRNNMCHSLISELYHLLLNS
jgi:hypothetical protein